MQCNRNVQLLGVIDLTREVDTTDEMQKAIAASLQDQPGILGGQISREDQEISRYVPVFLIYKGNHRNVFRTCDISCHVCDTHSNLIKFNKISNVQPYCQESYLKVPHSGFFWLCAC